MENFKAITAVYSYYFPEVREIIDDLIKDYPHKIFLQSVSGGLDNFHIPIIEKYADWQSYYLRHLNNFTFQYPTAGAEEGIREALTLLQANGVKTIYTLKGEYEGYKEVAKTRGITTLEIDETINAKKLPRGYWFISNPSARDGNYIPDGVIWDICEAGHFVFYDLSYVGLTESFVHDLGHPNILGVFVSFSKPFGLFYYRMGFTFSRKPIPSLYGNKWFKNVFSLLIAEKIMEKLGPSDIFRKYNPVQERIVDEINKRHKLGMKRSNVILLGYILKGNEKGFNQSQLEMIWRFKRGNGYRFCLTPYFLDLENEK